MSGSMSATTWRAANAEWLTLALEGLRLRLHRSALWLERPLPTGARGVAWLITERTDSERRFHETDEGSRAMTAAIATIERQLVERELLMRESSRPPALRGLAEVVTLSPFEEQLLLLAAAPSLDGAFARAYAELNDDARRPYATLHLALAHFVDGVSDRLRAADTLMPSRTLRELRLIDVADDDSEPVLTRRLGVDERVSDYLRGFGRADTRVLPLLEEVVPSIACDATGQVADQIAQIIASEKERWPTVNLVGTVETGARDAAERACASLGLRLVALDIARLAMSPVAERTELLALLGREALLGGFAMIVDTERSRDSALANLVDEVIERVAATVFVVSRDRWPGDGEAHRATHVVEVRKPTRPEQRGLWRAALVPYQHSVNGEIDAIVQQFDFGPTSIAAAVARASRRSGGSIDATDLWRSCREESGVALDDLARRITPCYGWDDIVVADDVRTQLREVASQVQMRAHVYDVWGFGAQLGRGRGITALFSGPSGTGKTMAAEILAAHLELDLYRIDLAGVVSKYIGETEKNLRRVFDSAERSGVILFFDEADALFGTRTEVRDSHDRYANVEINYLLQRMEDYAGLAILATNRRVALDPAFLRRLRFVINFPLPSADERRSIWERVFPPQAEVDGIEYGLLSRLELTGGNIRSIAVNAAFLAAAEHTALGMPQLARAAAREYAKLSKPISPTEFGQYYAAARP